MAVNKAMPVQTGEQVMVDSLLYDVVNIPTDELWVNRRPAYYSKQLDRYLRGRKFSVPEIGSAIAIVGLKLGALPVGVYAKNGNIGSHQRVADVFNQRVKNSWAGVRERFIRDILETANGGFLEILDDVANISRNPILPRFGFSGFRYLDSARVQRTSDPEYPFLYEQDGKKYKLHYTRVLDMVYSQVGDSRFNGTGVPPVLLCDHQLRIISSVYRIYDEYMGNRTRRQIIVIGGGLTEEALTKQIKQAKESDLNDNRSSSPKTLILRSAKGHSPEIQSVLLSQLPEGFNREAEERLTINAIARAFGVDPREFSSATKSGETKADAEVQDKKTQQKMPAWFVATLSDKIRYQILPDYLDVSIDYTDEEKTEAQERAHKLRAETGLSELTAEVIDKRVYRQREVRAGILTQEQFRVLELQDGRLANGVDVLSLFTRDDDRYSRWLAFSEMPDIRAVRNNEPDDALDLLTGRIELLENQQGVGSEAQQVIAQECLYALYALSQRYRESIGANAVAQATTVAEADFDTNADDADDDMGDDETKSGSPLTPPHQYPPADRIGWGDDLWSLDQHLGMDDLIHRAEKHGNGTPSTLPASPAMNGGTALLDAPALDVKLFTPAERQMKVKALEAITEIDKSEKTLAKSIRDALRGIWDGQLTRVSARQSIERAVRSEVRKAFNAEAKDEGIKPAEFTDKELDAIDDIVDETIAYIPALLDRTEQAIADGKGKQAFIRKESQAWGQRFQNWLSKARLLFSGNKKLKWKIGSTKESCKDCLYANGRVHRASTWDAKGWVTQSTKLACSGFNCLCELTKTTEATTKSALRTL